jgi:hypothetical protein
MVRQRENDVTNSVSFAYIHAVNMHGVNFKASLIIVFDNF